MSRSPAKEYEDDTERRHLDQQQAQAQRCVGPTSSVASPSKATQTFLTKERTSLSSGHPLSDAKRVGNEPPKEEIGGSRALLCAVKSSTNSCENGFVTEETEAVNTANFGSDPACGGGSDASGIGGTDDNHKRSAFASTDMSQSSVGVDTDKATPALFGSDMAVAQRVGTAAGLPMQTAFITVNSSSKPSGASVTLKSSSGAGETAPAVEAAPAVEKPKLATKENVDGCSPESAAKQKEMGRPSSVVDVGSVSKGQSKSVIGLDAQASAERPGKEETPTMKETIKPTRSRTNKTRAPPLPGQSTGRWTKSEHEAFLRGLKIHGREWKKVAQGIPTRNSAQIRSHAQKYFAKLAREENLCYNDGSVPVGQQQGVHDLSAVSPLNSGINAQPAPTGSVVPNIVGHMPASVQQNVQRILSDPEGAQREVEETLRALRERYRQLQIRAENERRRRTVGGGEARVVEDESTTNVAGGQQGREQPHEQRKAPVGPATAALEREQSRLRRAEQAAIERKRIREEPPPSHVAFAAHPHQQDDQHQDGDAMSVSSSSMAASLASMSPNREFGSEELIALHVLGGALPHSASREDFFVPGQQRTGIGSTGGGGDNQNNTSSAREEEEGRGDEEGSSAGSEGSKKRKLSCDHEEDGSTGERDSSKH